MPDSSDTAALSNRIDRALLGRVRAAARLHGMTLRAVLERALGAWLDGVGEVVVEGSSSSRYGLLRPNPGGDEYSRG